ncbi:ABC transporter ATP-binding protein [Hoeflea poritis]|uniref:Sn-glycerol-3-phosphate ABC transporter ATP-binding protein UgpC n=1 Tax=Hoeflea poritis TaxID=2993659 RepID=A0ABT4VN92_9HYPH|nr:sn-glycerol-3-phosphate ABC transporter ATP-binding protein UgpC [Hoeflea poritis]MDA4846178.1 sn-glycerol-3-phosphate ABC transporter ATP-binding protein UgpC [Hoeflea poritis]
MASVTLSSVSKSFGAVKVLENISTEIHEGEFVVLVGPSGCGKSTLLRMIAGLEDITEGTISIAGQVVNDTAPKERDIAMVFQNYALYPHMTVAENMAFSMTLAGSSKAEKERRVREAADILGLNDLLERKPKALSGGQRQRVAMGRAIVRSPRVFLFDEPLSNLDAKLRVAMRAEIRALHQRLKSTSIYVTHDQVEAMTMADRIVVLNGGKIEQVGAPLKLYDDPANTFVASFIGSPAMNFMEAEIMDGDGGRSLVLQSGAKITAPAWCSRPSGTPVTIGVRPEHFLFGQEGVEMSVEVVEHTGSETHIIANHGSQKIVAVTNQRLDAAYGDKMKLGFPTGTMLLFDRETGERIRE